MQYLKAGIKRRALVHKYTHVLLEAIMRNKTKKRYRYKQFLAAKIRKIQHKNIYRKREPNICFNRKVSSSKYFYDCSSNSFYEISRKSKYYNIFSCDRLIFLSCNYFV